MDDYRTQITRAVEAVSIDSTTTFSWFGQPSRGPEAGVRRLLSPEAARRFLLARLERRLYESFYQVGGAVAAPALGHSHRGRENGDFVAALSAANNGRGRLDEDWQIRTLPDGRLTARKSGLEVRVGPSEIVHREAGRAAVRLPKAYPALSPGYYMAVGDKDLPPLGPSVSRLYWNVTASGAVPLMRMVTEEMNRLGLPFRMKAVNRPDAYLRCDAVVTYLLNADYERVKPVFAGIWSQVQLHLRPLVPALTKMLLPGLGYAEDPATGHSFGQHRSRLIAEALVLAHEEGRNNLSDRMVIVEQRLAEAGVAIEAPYRSSNAADVTTLELNPPQRRSGRPNKAEPLEPNCLDSAIDIGSRLSKSAIWHGEKCNWVAPLPDAGGIVAKSLGHDLYAGTAGVGMFLAELAAVTKDRTFRHTAECALNHALSSVRERANGADDSLFMGRLGIALASARAGKVLESTTLIDEARGLTRCLSTGFVAGRGSEFDLVTGRAGAVLGLVLLSSSLGDSFAINLALHLADQLCDDACWDEGVCSWPTQGSASQQNLTGYAHGAAGIAHALLELYAITGNALYADIARRAFDYERQWFNEEVGNWPDFRGIPSKNARSARLPYFMGWCHGAPGIAIARLRAFEILRDHSLLEDGTQALKTTTAALSDSYSAAESCLCHGFTGLATVVGYGAAVLGDSNVAKADVVVNRQNAWPLQYSTPGLMIGEAGVGHFLLRQHDPTIPSPLLLRAGDFW